MVKHSPEVALLHHALPFVVVVGTKKKKTASSKFKSSIKGQTPRSIMEIHVGRFHTCRGKHTCCQIFCCQWLRPALTITLTRLTHPPTTTAQVLFRLDTKVSVMFPQWFKSKETEIASVVAVDTTLYELLGVRPEATEGKNSTTRKLCGAYIDFSILKMRSRRRIVKRCVWVHIERSSVLTRYAGKAREHHPVRVKNSSLK